MKIKLEGEIMDDKEEENKKIIDERVRDDKEKEKNNRGRRRNNDNEGETVRGAIKDDKSVKMMKMIIFK